MPTTLFWLIPVGSVFIGTLFVLRGVRTVTADRRRRESWLRYPGRVVGSRLVSSGFSDDLTADQTQCRIAYVRDGREIEFWNRFTSTMLSSPDGRVVEVLVNPDDAGDAVVSDGLANGRVVGVVFALAGAFFVVVGLGIGLHTGLR